MRLLGLLCAGIALAAQGPHASLAAEECPTTFTYSTYEVSGDSLEALRVSMRERGPVDENGVRRYASTEWKVRWQWERDEKGRVFPESVTLKCDVVIMLPRLSESSGASEQTKTSWNDLIAKIKEHELQHARHIQTTAPRIQKRIRAQHKRDGFVSVEAANKIAQKVVQEARDLDRTYDSETEHGKREGI